MTAGRPPIPQERRKKLAAGDGQRSGGHRDVKPGTLVPVPRDAPVGVPEPPEGLAERGLTEWDKIWAAGRPWMHPNEDYHWVEQIVRAYDDIEVFRAQVKKRGLYVSGYAGQVVANPLLKEIRVLEATIRTCLSKLGFSPADRASLGLAEIKRQSGLAELQNRTKANRR